MAGNLHQRAAELAVLEAAVGQLGWPAVDGNAAGRRSLGSDVKLLRPRRPLLISVKRRATHASFEIGRSFRTYLVDVHAFVDAAVSRPWPIWLVGARTVEALALGRQQQYQRSSDPPRDPDALGRWSPKRSRHRLHRLAANPDNWDLLTTSAPEVLPAVSAEHAAIAAADGWPRRPERRRRKPGG